MDLGFPRSIPTGAITTTDGRYTPAVPQPSPDWPYHEISREQVTAIMKGHDYRLPPSLAEASPVRLSPSETAAPSVPPEGERIGGPADVSDRPATPAGPESWPQNLDSRAVGVAHEMLAGNGSINVSEVARRLGVERTALYRDCPAFRAMLATDRQSKEDRRKGFRRGSKDYVTRGIECADDD